MRQPEDVFFRSTFSKVVTMIDKWGDEQKAISDAINGKQVAQVKTAKSLKEIMGGLC